LHKKHEKGVGKINFLRVGTPNSYVDLKKNPEYTKVRTLEGYLGFIEIRFSMDYVGDYIVDLNLKGREKTTFGASIYTHRLNEEQYMDLKDLVEWQEGKLTTDNYRHESRVEIIDIKKINDHNKRFAGGYDQILNHLLEEGVFGHTRVRIENCLPPINIIARGKLVEDKDGPTFELLKENFYNYNGKNKIEDV